MAGCYLSGPSANFHFFTYWSFINTITFYNLRDTWNLIHYCIDYCAKINVNYNGVVCSKESSLSTKTDYTYVSSVKLRDICLQTCTKLARRSYTCKKVVKLFHPNPKCFHKTMHTLLFKAYTKSDLIIKSAPLFPTVDFFCIDTIEGHVKY